LPTIGSPLLTLMKKLMLKITSIVWWWQISKYSRILLADRPHTNSFTTIIFYKTKSRYKPFQVAVPGNRILLPVANVEIPQPNPGVHQSDPNGFLTDPGRNIHNWEVIVIIINSNAQAFVRIKTAINQITQFIIRIRTVLF